MTLLTGSLAPTVTLQNPDAGDNFTAASKVRLAATAADPDGNLQKVEFYVNGVLEGTASRASSLNPAAYPFSAEWSVKAVGIYTVVAVAEDSSGNRVMSAPVTVSAAVGVSAPVVTLNAPAATATATLGNTINFSATASDAGGVVTTVAFYVNGNPISIDDTTPYVGSFTPAATGVYEITAVALDDSGNETVSNLSTVTVNPVAGTAPSVVLTSPVPAGTTGGNTPASLTVGQASTLNLIAQVTPGSAAIDNVKFYAVSAQNGPTQIGSGTLVSAGSFLYQNSYASALTVGDYNLVAVVTDAAGNTATSANVGIKVVQTATTAPVVTLAAPVPGTVVQGRSTLLTASATPASGATISSVAFYVNGVLVNTDTAAPYNFSYTAATVGSYKVVAVATDSAGNTSVSAEQAFTLTANAGPVVSISALVLTVELGSPLAISATATDTDGMDRVVFTEYLGTAINDAIKTTEDRLSPYGYQFNPTQTGQYIIRAEAFDDLGFSDTASLVVNVVRNTAKPTIEFIAPAVGATAVVGQATPVEVKVTVPTGATANSIAFFANGVKIGDGFKQGTLDVYRLLVDANNTQLPWSPSVTGSLALTAEIVDSFGGRAETAAARQIQVVGQVGALPFVEIIQPVPPATTGGGTPASLSATTNSDLNLAASAVDSDGTVSSVEFFLDLGRAARPTATVTFPSVVVNGAALQQSTGYISSITFADGGIGYLSPPEVRIIGDGSGATAEAEILNGAISRIRITNRGSGYTNAIVRLVGGGLVENLSIGFAVRDFTSDVWRLATPFNFKSYGAGFYTFRAVAKDNNNNVQSSSAVSVTVSTAPLTTPVTGNVVSTPSTSNVDGQRVAAGQTVQLALNPTVVGGTVASVEFFANGESVGVDTDAPYIVNWIPAYIGSYNVLAVVTDSVGNRAVSAALPVYVGGNIAPTISLVRPAASGATGVLNQEVLLEAEAMALTPGSFVSSVEFVADGESVGIAQQVGVSNRFVLSSWRPATIKPYSITARVVDSFGQAFQTPARVLTVVAQTGVIPTVVLTSPANTSTGGTTGGGLVVSNNSSLLLSAQANDADGSVSKVEFLISRGQHATATATRPPFSTNVTGITVTSGGTGYLYAPRVKIVGNGVGALAEAVVANGIVTSIRVLSAGSGYTSLPQVVIEGGGLYENLVVGTATNVSGTLTWSTSLDLRNYDVGPYSFRARATDNAGNTVISAATPVIISAATASAPVVTLSDPSPSIVTLGQASNLVATASSAVGTSVAKVDFYANGSIVSTATTSPYLLAFNATAEGSYQIFAVVTDSAGNAAVSQGKSLTVKPLVGTAPTVTLTDTTAVKLATRSKLPFTAVVTLGNSPVSSVQFFANNINGGAATLLGVVAPVTGSTTYQLVYTNTLAAGDYTVYAVVTDTNGNIVQSATRSVTSVAVTAPTVRVISPTAGAYNVLDSTTFAAASARVTTRPATNPTFNGDQDITGVVIEDEGLNYDADVTAYIEVRNDPAFGGGVARTESLTVTLGANGIISGLAIASGGNARLFFYQSAVVVIEDNFNIPALTVVTSATAASGVEIVRLYANGVLIGSKASVPYTFAWSPSRAGTYQLHAEVTDSDGITASSDPVTIVINQADDVAPVETLAAIENAYQAVFGRSPTNEETVSAVDRFGVALSSGQVAALLLQSSDFRDDQGELILSHLAVWGEYPTASQYAALETQRDFNLTDVQIVDALLASVSYKERYGNIADLNTVNSNQYNRIRALALRTYRNLYGKDPSNSATANAVAKQFFYNIATLLQTPGQAVVNFTNENFAGGKSGTTLTRLRMAGAILLIGNEQPTKARIDAFAGLPLAAVADYYFDGGAPFSAGTVVSIETAEGTEAAGTTYYASGLPKGLTIDRTTGVISGRLPSTAKAYAITFWTQVNGVRGATATRVLVVEPLDSKFVGTNDVLLLDADGLPGGKLSVKVAGTASYTGTLIYRDGRSYSFKGVLSVLFDEDGESTAYGEQSPIKRKAPLSALQIGLFFDADGRLSASVTEGDDIDPIAEGEAIRVFTFTKSAPAPWQGTRAVNLTDISSETFFLDGAGSGTLKVANTGVLSVSLKGADGAKITGSASSSIASEYRLYSRPYSKKPEGYFAGSIKFSDEATPALVEFPADDNDLTWFRPAGLAPYGEGFGPLKIQLDYD